MAATLTPERIVVERPASPATPVLDPKIPTLDWGYDNPNGDESNGDGFWFPDDNWDFD